MKGRVVVLLIANVIAVIVLFYFLDMFGVNNTYSKIQNQFNSRFKKGEGELFRAEDPWLIEREEQKKLMESFDLREADFVTLEKSLAERERALLGEKTALEEERVVLETEKLKLEEAKNVKESYEAKVEKLAVQYSSMPPDAAVKIIIGLNDDLLILDVFKKMDEVAAKSGMATIVPYMYTLMSAADASRLQRKSTIDK